MFPTFQDNHSGPFVGAQEPTVCKYAVNILEILFVENNAPLSFHTDIQLNSKQGERLSWHTRKGRKIQNFI